MAAASPKPEIHQFSCLKDNYGVLLRDAASGVVAAVTTGRSTGRTDDERDDPEVLHRPGTYADAADAGERKWQRGPWDQVPWGRAAR